MRRLALRRDGGVGNQRGTSRHPHFLEDLGVLWQTQPLPDLGLVGHSGATSSMAKLYFRYGTVGSAKTLNLLAVAHSYDQQNKRVLVMKPALDTRFGVGLVKSRAGLMRDADILLEPDTILEKSRFEGISCVLIDEAQFVSRSVVDQLRSIATELDIPVICYGLRSDFRTALFEGAQRLFELADEIAEIKTTCFFCNSRALFNLKLLNGLPTVEGPSIELGAEERYLPACAGCYAEKLKLRSVANTTDRAA